jgi:hypothetical protein
MAIRLITASHRAESVRRYTSQDCVTDRIQVPLTEISWPKKNKR